MSREFKFRAWNKRDQKMYEVSGFFFGQVMFISPQENATSYTINSIPEGQLELMQYTGLKDRNGREIYEGDIVQWGIDASHPLKRTFKRAVTYENARAMFLPNMEGDEEIIGNIYENPELLKKDGEA